MTCWACSFSLTTPRFKMFEVLLMAVTFVIIGSIVGAALRPLRKHYRLVDGILERDQIRASLNKRR